MTDFETNSTNDPERLAFHTTIRETMQRYLEMFPNEEGRQSELQSKLANPDLDLRLRSTIPDGHMCASGIILLPGSKILMLEHKALGIWVVPGGHYDLVDENLAATAIRETVEETGIANVTLHPWHLEHGVPLDIDTHPIPARPEKGEGAHQHFDFRYILEIADPEQTIENLRIDPNEVLSFKVMDINEVDPTSSIAPALKKLGLITG
jgi:8-oxo-dGTP pyrophosphatase MutT (NUDIX family)